MNFRANRTSTAIVAAVAGALLALSGCGGDGDGAGAQDAATPSASASPSGEVAANDAGATPSASPSSSGSATPTPGASITPTGNMLVWSGDPKEFGGKALDLLKGVAAGAGITLPNIGTDFLAKDATMKCGNAVRKGDDPTIPIFVWCKSTNKIVVAVAAVGAAQASKGFDYAVALVFDFAQAEMYASTNGAESERLHGCIVGVTLRGLAALPQVGVDVGSDFATRMIALYKGDFRIAVDEGFTKGGSACPK